ncbi:hypothetical protein SDRG_01606 [Saprolegnia diclina VS20]|uniref:Cytochrome P450 n=1 Tax=Saprolegnia diclina (strain VS20) TaxID=1156394 RepID=T0S8N3_SAPDV|nr:hypothetical protein SDRG_01606 [Saprolegnia diclina VS20]EQC41648.1 hypothetical protein SDRG_01606 [Saprolegnia diclina VS20]|eukprot:XP_008605362.1 hypothetical protein SDRG_01606 [Saprolegnia diclina VS20]
MHRASNVVNSRPRMPPTTSAFPARLLGHLGDLDLFGSSRGGRIGHRLLERFGDWYAAVNAKTFCVRLGGQDIIVTKDPRVFKPVLGQFLAHFEPSTKARAAVGSLMPSHVFVQESADDWARVRKVLSHALAQQDVERIPSIASSIVDTLTVPSSGTMDVVPEVVMPKLAFDMVSQLLFDWDPKTMSGESLPLLASALLVSDVIGERTMLPLPWLWRLPLPRNRDANAARDVLRAHVQSFVAARGPRHSPTSLLDAMVAATSDGNLSATEMRDNLLALFFGAFDNTAHTLSILFNLLATHPEVQDELYAALLSAFPNGASEIATATSSQLRDVPYLCWTVDEVLRLKPAVPVISRQCVAPCVIHGVEFRAGDDVLIDGGSACRDADYGPGHSDLDVFRPSRFGDTFAALDKSVLLSFGAGKRLCPGRSIALSQVRAVCAYVIATFHVSRPASSPPLLFDLKLTVTTRAGHGTMVWTKRKE